MKDTKIWVSYHDENLVKKYNLDTLDKNIFRLFNTNDNNIDGENLNHINKAWCEMVTMYYVWKHQIKSDQVGFCHYRRLFDSNEISDINENECIVFHECIFEKKISMFDNYIKHHSYNDLMNTYTYLKYSNMDEYAESLLNTKDFIIGCCFIMDWNNFNKMCNWLFDILFHLDKLYKLNLNLNLYITHYYNEFKNEDDKKKKYQLRNFAFMSERLISIWIKKNLKTINLKKLNSEIMPQNDSQNNVRKEYITFDGEKFEDTKKNKKLIDNLIQEIKSNNLIYKLYIHKTSYEDKSILLKRYLTVNQLLESHNINRDRYRIKLVRNSDKEYLNNKILIAVKVNS